jgi:hypothetical protein
MRRHAGFVVAAVLVSPIPASLAHAAPPIVVESRCASGSAYIEGGTGWVNSSAKSNRTSCAAGSRSTKDAAAYADFIPPIVTEGLYDVYATWGQTTNNNDGPNAEHVQFSIIDRDGTRSTFVDMRGLASCAGANADQLILIGRGYFQPNLGQKVRLSNTATGQCALGSGKRFVTADAVVFNFVDLTPAVPRSWGKLKVIYRN